MVGYRAGATARSINPRRGEKDETQAFRRIEPGPCSQHAH